MTEQTSQSAVLLVEDDDQDAFLFEKMLREEVGATHIDRVTDGEGALKAVQAKPDFDCIVLDLNLNGEDGLWVLEHLSKTPEHARIPVIVFSGDAARLQQACSNYDNVVSSVRKPETFEQYRTALTIVGAILGAAMGAH